MNVIPAPDVIAAADWSVRPAGRVLAIAQRASDGAYRVDFPPRAILDPKGLLGDLRAAARSAKADGGQVLFGVDFPIGVPAAYARAANLPSFRTALSKFGIAQGWERFFEVSDAPALNQPFGPKSNLKNGLKRDQLATLIGLMSESELYRRCDQKTGQRYRAEALFFTRFARQVGRSACEGWRDLLQPNRDDILIWPFDGLLRELLGREQATVIAEIYPAEAVAQLELSLGPKSGKSKASRSHRSLVASAIERWARDFEIALGEQVSASLREGFDSEDAFDAFVSLVAMVGVIRGAFPVDPPDDPDVLDIEGWILGRQHTQTVPRGQTTAVLVVRVIPAIKPRVPHRKGRLRKQPEGVHDRACSSGQRSARCN